MKDAQNGDRKEIVTRPDVSLAGHGSRLVRRGLDSLKQTRIRILHFPTEHSVGELGTCPEGSHTWHDANIFAEAKGDVRFVGDAPLLLGIASEVNERSFLKNLQHDDIQYLDFGFGFGEVSDDDLRHVAHLTGLLAISGFDAPRLTSAGVALLRNLKQLRVFDSPYFPMDDDCLCELAHLTALETLTAFGHLTDAGFDHLRNLTRLRNLTISSTWDAITEDALQFIGELKDLEFLYVHDCVLTDRFIDSVERLPKLKLLSIGKSAITDNGLHRLRQATNAWYTLRNNAGVRVER